MKNKKNMLFLFVGLIVICLTVSAVSAAESNATGVVDTQTTEIQKTVENTQTDTGKTEQTSNKINKTTDKNVKSTNTYYVATDGKSSNNGTQTSPYDLKTAVRKVNKEKGGNLILETGTYKLDSLIKLNTVGTYSISSQNSNTVTLDGQFKTRLMYVGKNVSVEIENIAFSNGKMNGAGGAICVDYDGSLKLTNCNFANNKGSYGGAIYTRGSTFEVTESNFINNTASKSGGAIYSKVNDVAITSNNFTFNLAKGSTGGAICNKGSSATITDNVFTKNNAKAIKNVIRNIGSDSTITDNVNADTSSCNGTIYNKGDSVKITNNIFLDKKNATLKLTVTPNPVEQYGTIKFTATIFDSSTGEKIRDKASNYVIFKINGVTVKNSTNQTLKVRVVNGVATYEYVIPQGTAGYTPDDEIRYYNVTAGFSSHEYSITKQVKTKFTVKRSNVTISTTTLVANMTSKTIKIVGTLKDYKGNIAVGKSLIGFKINGYTVFYNGEPITEISNGEFSVTLTIPNDINYVNDVTIVSGAGTTYEGARVTISKVTRVK